MRKPDSKAAKNADQAQKMADCSGFPPSLTSQPVYIQHIADYSSGCQTLFFIRFLGMAASSYE